MEGAKGGHCENFEMGASEACSFSPALHPQSHPPPRPPALILISYYLLILLRWYTYYSSWCAIHYFL